MQCLVRWRGTTGTEAKRPPGGEILWRTLLTQAKPRSSISLLSAILEAMLTN